MPLLLLVLLLPVVLIALMPMMTVGCLAESVSSPARNGGARAPLDGDRYTTEQDNRDE